MTYYAHRIRNSTRRRAVVVIQVGVMLVVLLGFAALTVDLGTLYNARGDLQRTADAAALAGASTYLTDEMMQIRMGNGGYDTMAYVTALGTSRAGEFAALNPTIGTSVTNVGSGDVQTGWINLYSASETIHTNPQPKDYNAVKVTVRREGGDSEGSNPPVQLFFAAIFGRLSADASASAVAVFDDRFRGISAGAPGAGMTPFTISENAFGSELAGGGDQYAYDEASDTVSASPDGIREIRLYPYPLSGSGYAEGDGNFGMLNIGTGNQGVEAERVQIINGASADDFVMEVGTSELDFFDDSGNPITYEITGSPGMESSLTSALEEITGQVVGFFVHEQVVLFGSNSVYTITGIRYGRVMAMRLTGPPAQRGFYVQPVSYAGGEVRIHPDAPSSDGLVGRIVLAR